MLGQLRDNFRVLKGQMGFNNPQAQTSRFSLRQELFRLLRLVGRELARDAAALLHAEHLRQPGGGEAGQEALRR